MMIHLGHRHVESLPQRGGERLQHVPLLLERVASWDAKVEPAQRGEHLPHGPLLLVGELSVSYNVRATSRTSYVSTTSPSWTSWKFSRPIPHSKPSATSRTSSLNRRSDPTRPVYTMAPSRTSRAREPRVMAPLVTMEPATTPKRGTRNSCRTSARPSSISCSKGASIPD